MKRMLLLSCFVINAGLIASDQEAPRAWAPLLVINILHSYEECDGYLISKGNVTDQAVRHCQVDDVDGKMRFNIARLQITCEAFLNAGFRKGKQFAGITDVFLSSSSNPQKVGFILVALMALYGTAHLALTIKNKLVGKSSKE